MLLQPAGGASPSLPRTGRTLNLLFWTVPRAPVLTVERRLCGPIGSPAQAGGPAVVLLCGAAPAPGRAGRRALRASGEEAHSASRPASWRAACGRGAARCDRTLGPKAGPEEARPHVSLRDTPRIAEGSRAASKAEASCPAVCNNLPGNRA